MIFFNDLIKILILVDNLINGNHKTYIYTKRKQQQQNPKIQNKHTKLQCKKTTDKCVLQIYACTSKYMLSN